MHIEAGITSLRTPLASVPESESAGLTLPAPPFLVHYLPWVLIRHAKRVFLEKILNTHVAHLARREGQRVKEILPHGLASASGTDNACSVRCLMAASKFQALPLLPNGTRPPFSLSRYSLPNLVILYSAGIVKVVVANKGRLILKQSNHE